MTQDADRRVRSTDPSTSARAAERDPADDQALRDRLLIEWVKAGEDGLTDYEAADRASVLNRTFWKRAGELRQPERGGDAWAAAAGEPLLAWHPDGLTRKSLQTGGARKVSVITERGREYAAEHELIADDPDALRAEIVRLEIIIDTARHVALDGGTRRDVLAELDKANPTDPTDPTDPYPEETPHG